MSLSKLGRALWDSIKPEPETIAPRAADPAPTASVSPPSSPSAEKAASLGPAWDAADAELLPPSAASSTAYLQARCGVTLRPWDAKFIHVACAWRNDSRFLHLWNANRKHCSREEIQDEIRFMLDNTVFFLIHFADREEPIGCVYAGHPASEAQRYLRVNVMLPPENQKPGHSIAATLLFLQHLFSHFEISKVAFEIYGWNIRSIKATAHLPQVQLEGIRRDHVVWNGKAYDQYEFGLSREAFDEIKMSSIWKRLIGE